jgi:hypothetical protein
MILATRLCPPYAVLFKLEFHLAAKPSHFSCSKTQRTRQCARKREARMALGLSDVRCDPVANRALEELMHHYTVAEEKGWLVLTKKAGDMQLFLHDLDDLHQLDFIHNRQMVKETERFRALLTTIGQQRESWKARALMAEAQLLEATAKAGNDARGRNVSDVRYASLKRFLAKQFHPDYAPGDGIEKIVRNEFFKEIWNEIERLDQGGSRFARSAAAA